MLLFMCTCVLSFSLELNVGVIYVGETIRKCLSVVCLYVLTVGLSACQSEQSYVGAVGHHLSVTHS